MSRLHLLLTIGMSLAVSAVPAADDLQFFEARIRPVLVEHCYQCHSSASAEVGGGLLLDSRDALRAGGDSGPAVAPGDPTASLMLQAMRYESLEMPPTGKLADHVIADVERWIRAGAIDPRTEPPSPAEASETAWQAKLAERSQWWSLQPLRDVAPPAIDDADWRREGVDRFVRAALDRQQLSPALPADALTLLRRICFVLTGLPPTPEQVDRFPDAFSADEDAALAALVDRCLSSPHFGERMARRWMDVVRYTDTYGYEWDNPVPGSWEYRDYLIRAFNDDIGFDQLLREHLAGDLLPQPRINRQAGLVESLIGPMFYHLGEHRHGTSLDFNGIHQEMVNNKVDAFSKAFLAMTVACARCHDHKLDAVSQADYYALAGVFMSPRWTARVIDAPDKHAPQIDQLKQLRQDVWQELAKLWQAQTAAGALSVEQLREWAKANHESLQKVTLDDVAYPLVHISETTDAGVEDAWTKAAAQWATARQSRLSANAERFSVLTDFQQPGFPEGWIAEGDGLVHGYVQAGSPLISLEGESLIQSVLPRGYHTHALSSKLPGALHLPPQNELVGRHVSLELTGGEWAGYLVVPQNAFQTETVTFLDPAAPRRWHGIADSELKNGVTRVLLQVATCSLNPNFPPRTGIARAGGITLPPSDRGFDKRSWFSLTGAVSHDAAGAPLDVLDGFKSLYTEQTPHTVDAAWRRVAAWLQGVVQRWGSGKTAAGDVRVLNWLLAQNLLGNHSQDAPAAAVLVQRYREVERSIAFSRTAVSMDERGLAPMNYRLNIRGDVDQEGPVVPRGFLEVFDRSRAVGGGPSSGRRELAEHLCRDNPQAARVYVNRVWQWVFGAGLVATPNDFGKLGDRPSHPELLDWLTCRFIAEGWSTKRLVRRLMLSQTFRQSGAVSVHGAERDPGNRLLHHYPTRRLEAEAIRDSLLAVSGRLDRRLYGPPIKPPRPAEDAQKRLFSGPLDGEGRRSLYLEMSIMQPPQFLVGFNLPDLKLPTGRRDVTNVPAQALILLNDPLVVQSAELWAEHLMQDASESADERIHAMFLRALGRPPSPDESRRWAVAVGEFSQSHDVMKDVAAWAELAHALFNVKEFIYYR